MRHSNLPKIANVDWHPKRSTKPIYKSKVVLSTGFLQNSRTLEFESNLKKLKSNYNDATFLHFEWSTRDDNNIHRLVNSVPNVLYALNQSRPLRRAKISGIRACCLDTRHHTKYVCDFGFASFFGAVVITSGLLKYFDDGPKYVEVSFAPSHVKGRGLRRVLHALHMDYKTKFYTKSGLSDNSIFIEDISDETNIGGVSIRWRVTSTRMDLLDIVHSIYDIFGRDVDEVFFNGGYIKLRITRNIVFDHEQYVERPFDKLKLGIRFKRFSTFGRFHLDPEYMIY